MQRRLIWTKVYCKCLHSVLKEITHKPFKVGTAKTFFSSVYNIGTAYLGECFVFLVITSRPYFL